MVTETVCLDQAIPGRLLQAFTQSPNAWKIRHTETKRLTRQSPPIFKRASRGIVQTMLVAAAPFFIIIVPARGQDPAPLVSEAEIRTPILKLNDQLEVELLLKGQSTLFNYKTWHQAHPDCPGEMAIVHFAQNALESGDGHPPYEVIILFGDLRHPTVHALALSGAALINRNHKSFKRGLVLIWNEEMTLDPLHQLQSLSRAIQHEKVHLRHYWSIMNASELKSRQILSEATRLADPRRKNEFLQDSAGLGEFFQSKVGDALVAQDEIRAINASDSWSDGLVPQEAENQDRFSHALKTIFQQISGYIETQKRKDFKKWLKNLLSAEISDEATGDAASPGGMADLKHPSSGMSHQQNVMEEAA